MDVEPSLEELLLASAHSTTADNIPSVMSVDASTTTTTTITITTTTPASITATDTTTHQELVRDFTFPPEDPPSSSAVTVVEDQRPSLTTPSDIVRECAQDNCEQMPVDSVSTNQNVPTSLANDRAPPTPSGNDHPALSMVAETLQQLSSSPRFGGIHTPPSTMTPSSRESTTAITTGTSTPTSVPGGSTDEVVSHHNSPAMLPLHDHLPTLAAYYQGRQSYHDQFPYLADFRLYAHLAPPTHLFPCTDQATQERLWKRSESYRRRISLSMLSGDGEDVDLASGCGSRNPSSGPTMRETESLTAIHLNEAHDYLSAKQQQQQHPTPQEEETGASTADGSSEMIVPGGTIVTVTVPSVVVVKKKQSKERKPKTEKNASTATASASATTTTPKVKSTAGKSTAGPQWKHPLLSKSFSFYQKRFSKTRNGWMAVQTQLTDDKIANGHWLEALLECDGKLSSWIASSESEELTASMKTDERETWMNTLAATTTLMAQNTVDLRKCKKRSERTLDHWNATMEKLKRLEDCAQKAAMNAARMTTAAASPNVTTAPKPPSLKEKDTIKETSKGKARTKEKDSVKEPEPLKENDSEMLDVPQDKHAGGELSSTDKQSDKQSDDSMQPEPNPAPLSIIEESPISAASMEQLCTETTSTEVSA